VLIANGSQYAVLNGKTVVTIATVKQTPVGPTDFYLIRSDDGGKTWTQSRVFTSPYEVSLPVLMSTRAESSEWCSTRSTPIM
jgi:hypothetical protein